MDSAEFIDMVANDAPSAEVSDALKQMMFAKSAEFVDAAGTAQAQTQREDMAGQGVTFSPTYLLDGEPFQGRQHLPLLRSLMTQ